MKSSPRLRKVSNEISIFCVHTVFHTQYTHQEDHARDTKNIILSDFTFSLFTQARDARIIVGLFSEEKAVEVFCQVTVGEWDFRFCGFGYFSDRFFRSLCQKTAVFRFCRVVTVVCGFSVLKHLVFGICKKKKKKTGLRIWCPM